MNHASSNETCEFGVAESASKSRRSFWYLLDNETQVLVGFEEEIVEGSISEDAKSIHGICIMFYVRLGLAISFLLLCT